MLHYHYDRLLNHMGKAAFVKDCTAMTVVKFLFENVVTRFGFSKILLSDQDTHFVTKMIDKLTVEFQIQ